MKIEEINKKTEFQPIVLKVTIETEQELCNLWHRFNLGTVDVLRHSSDGIVKYEPLHSDDDWEFIDNLFESRGLKH